jgi:hypothetical protein
MTSLSRRNSWGDLFSARRAAAMSLLSSLEMAMIQMEFLSAEAVF